MHTYKVSSLQGNPLEASGKDKIALAFGFFALAAHVRLAEVLEVAIQYGLPTFAEIAHAAEPRQNVLLHHRLVADRALDLVPSNIAANWNEAIRKPYHHTNLALANSLLPLALDNVEVRSEMCAKAQTCSLIDKLSQRWRVVAFHGQVVEDFLGDCFGKRRLAEDKVSSWTQLVHRK